MVWKATKPATPRKYLRSNAIRTQWETNFATLVYRLYAFVPEPVRSNGALKRLSGVGFDDFTRPFYRPSC